MEAGYDFTLLGDRRRRKLLDMPTTLVGILAGILIVSGIILYSIPSSAEAEQTVAANSGQHATAGAAGPGGDDPATSPIRYRVVAPASPEDISGQQLYPAGFSESQYWVNPLGYE